MGNHNENQFFNLNKSTDKKSKRHFVPIEEMKNQNNLKKSSKTIRPNKNSINNIKVSKSNQQIGKGFSVQASILKKKLKCNYSKTCKNFNVMKLLKMNNYEDLKVDIAFFSDDENIKQNKKLYSVLKKYKKINELRRIIDQKKRRDLDNKKKNLTNKNIINAQNIKQTYNYLSKIQKDPIKQSLSGKSNLPLNRSFAKKNNKQNIQKSGINRNFLPNINNRNLMGQDQILHNKRLNSIQKSIPLKSEANNSIIRNNPNSELNRGSFTKLSNSRKKNKEPNNSLLKNEIGSSFIRFPLNKSLDEKNLKRIKESKDYTNISQNQQSNNKLSNLTPISEKRQHNISQIEENNSLSPEDKVLRRFQYWQKIVYPNYLPNFCNGKHIELELNSFLSNKHKNPRFKFIGLNELANFQ